MTQDELLKLIDRAAEEGWTELDLAGADLTELPPEIGKLTQLRKLILGKDVQDSYLGNQLTELPAEVGLLESLAILQAPGNWRYENKDRFPRTKAGNQLNKISFDIGQLKNLQKLDLSHNHLSILPAEIGQLEELQLLDLSDNNLSMLPFEIINLKKLRDLSISSNKLSNLPSGLEELKALRSINLNSNQLGKITREIFDLTNLQELYLGWNQLNEIPSEIGKLTNIQRLSLHSNQLNRLPLDIFNLTKLEWLSLGSNQIKTLSPHFCQFFRLNHLDLHNNRLSDLPVEIFKIPDLQNLYLGSNQIQEISDEISQLVSLQVLDLSGNKLSQLPQRIKNLPNLQYLDLSRNQLLDLPSQIFKIKSLCQLNLSLNQLRKVPSDIGELNKIEVLGLFGNQLEQLPSSIKRCSNLKKLDISSNRFKSVPNQIFNLKNLEHLSISTNFIKEIPKELGMLRNLSVLRLGRRSLGIFRREYNFEHGNKIECIPQSLEWLPSLQELELASNEIREISPYILNFDSLQELDLRGNPVPIPPEILGPKESWKKPGYLKEILDYYFQVLNPDETDPLYESKFIIVGEGGAGKTTFAKKLLNSEYELDTNEESTEGIDVIRWEFRQMNEAPFRTNIWDFGGQEIYHATHQFFLTKRSLYALVVDTRQDNTDLYYWLNIVSLLSDNSPVFIIKNEKQDRQCDVNERALRGEFANLEKVFATNLGNNRGLEAIKDAIQKSIVQLPHVGTPLPKLWVRVRAALENYANNCNYITVSKYRDLCCTNLLTEPNHQNSFGNYLHDLGVILHFHEDPILKHYVILKPEWGTAAVYDALDTKEIRENFGRFTRKQLNTIWEQDEYSNMQDELLQLMKNFKLCYEIPGCKHQYIAPQLLSPEQPDYPWDETSNLILRYRYDFMPKGILTRLIVELHQYIENQTLVWKTGVVFTNGTAHAKVTEHYPKNEIRIRVSGTNQKRWLAAITHELEKIHRSYEQLRYKTLIPCNCVRCQNSQKPHDYSYQRLQQFLNDGQYQIQCQESYKMVDVSQMLDDILYRNVEDLLLVNQEEIYYGHIADADNDQGLPLQPNELIRRNTPVQTYRPSQEVFISYSWGGDGEEIANKIDEALKTTKIRLIRDKRDLGFKGRIQQFMKQIGQGKAVIIIISDKYLKSENCMFELVEIAANDSFYERIFPIVLDDAQIYKPIKRIRYVQHWEQEIKELDEAMNTVSNANLQGFRESIDLYTRIRNTIAELTETLKDMNTLSPEIHTDSGFADLISAVKKRLES